MHQAAEHVFFSFFCIIIVFQIIRSSFRFILGEYQRILPTIFKEKCVSERSHGFPVYFYSFLLNWIFSLDPASPQICIAAFNYCAFFILRIPLLDILQTWIYTRQYFFFPFVSLVTIKSKFCGQIQCPVHYSQYIIYSQLSKLK